MTVLILTASYRDKEFVRVGYYVNTEYEDEARRLEPPVEVDFKGLIRNVLVEKPRVTRFNNPWDSELKSGPWGVSTDNAQGAVPGVSNDATSGMAGASGMQDPDQGGRDLLLDSPLPPPVVAAAAGSTSAGAPPQPAAGDVDMA